MDASLPWSFVAGTLFIAWFALQPNWLTDDRRPAWIRRFAKVQRILIVLFVAVIILIQFYSLLSSS
jgi:hypothetical protein